MIKIVPNVCPFSMCPKSAPIFCIFINRCEDDYDEAVEALTLNYARQEPKESPLQFYSRVENLVTAAYATSRNSQTERKERVVHLN